jgi:hypothetical protein
MVAVPAHRLVGSADLTKNEALTEQSLGQYYAIQPATRQQAGRKICPTCSPIRFFYGLSPQCR